MNIIEKFKCQRVSQKIHRSFRSKKDKPSRVENCYILRNGHSPGVTLKKKQDSSRAHYTGLQTCGSVWSCPICSSVISESRYQTVKESINKWRSMDSCNSVIMITWTIPHSINQSLSDVVEIQDRAVRIMKQTPQRKCNCKSYRTLIDEMCSVGSYTGREITFGKNGFHPHRHQLFFAPSASEDQLQQWQYEFTEAYLQACLKAGLKLDRKIHFYERAVQISQINDDDGYTRISKYITSVQGDNWSLAQEATKGISKTAKNGNITPFGMLQAIVNGDKYSKLYSLIFKQYAETMKGKKQFFPSPGLAKFLDINFKSDAEVIEEKEGGDIYYDLSIGDWNDILKFRIRGLILELTKIEKENFQIEFEKLLADFYWQEASNT